MTPPAEPERNYDKRKEGIGRAWSNGSMTDQQAALAYMDLCGDLRSALARVEGERNEYREAAQALDDLFWESFDRAESAERREAEVRGLLERAQVYVRGEESPVYARDLEAEIDAALAKGAEGRKS